MSTRAGVSPRIRFGVIPVKLRLLPYRSSLVTSLPHPLCPRVSVLFLCERIYINREFF